MFKRIKRYFRTPNIHTSLTYTVDYTIDTILRNKLKVGIYSFSSYKDRDTLEITFEDGTYASFYNAGKYNSWLCSGVIGDYRWNRQQPRKSTMKLLEDEMIRSLTNKNK